MHETLCSEIKGHVDIFRSHRLIGWAFHTICGSLPMRLQYKNESYEYIPPVERKDVFECYQSILSANGILCGFDCTIRSMSEIDELQVQVGTSWETVFRFQSETLPSMSIRRVHPPSLIVVDDFYENPDEVREYAMKQTFVSHPNNHKGKRTDTVHLFDGLKETFESLLGREIQNWTKYGTNGCFQYCIGGDQLVYHCDVQEYAAIVFLTPDAPPQTGTSFYRSKHTHHLTVSQEEIPIVFKGGVLDPTEFEMVDSVGNVYNRLVIFNANQIHSASCYFGNRLENGRLFQMFFFDL